MLFSILSNISLKGKLDIVDSNGKTHTFGSSEPYVKIKLSNKSIQRKLFINPSLYLGEGYMDGEIIIEEGTIEDFKIIFSNFMELLQQFLNHFTS